ncbi:MAG: hypothetical protein ACYC1K_00030 [Minisyncoccota bacterium]
MSGTQEKDPWIRFVYSPCDDDHQEVVDLVNEHELPVTLDSNELTPHTELRVNHGEVVTGKEIIGYLKERFASRITTMPSQTS